MAKRIKTAESKMDLDAELAKLKVGVCMGRAC
jgi:hypothetical protein